MRLEQSSTFQRSGALLLLLDFLVEASTGPEPVKETYIGAAFYKRDAAYDPRYDSIARVNVRRLRQRLEQFYATEGAEETFQIVIPVGSFTPALLPASPSSSIAEEPVAAPEPPPPPQLEVSPAVMLPARSRAGLWWSLLVLAAAIGCLAVGASMRLHRVSTFPTGPWRTVPLTSGHDLEFEPATTTDGQRLAYVTRIPETPRFGVFLRNFPSDTSIGTLLDTGPGNAFYPAWSPDSQKIAYLRCGEGPCEIATVPIHGGPARVARTLPLYTLPDDQPYYQFRQLGSVWTRDGESLIYPYKAPGDNAERLVQQNLASGAVRQLTSGMPGDDDGSPAISRDGRSVAFLRRNLDHTNIMTLNLESGVERVLETEPSHSASGITWAPDGSGVVIGIVRRESAPGLLWVPLQGAPRVLNVTLPGLLNPVFTGDGKALMVLSSNRNRNLAEVAGDDARPELIFHSKQKNSFSALSPDGRRLAFLSSLSGTFEVWLSDRQGTSFSAPRQLTHGIPYYPVSVAWAPDGRTLAIGISHTSQVEMVDAGSGAFQALQVPGLDRSNVWSPAWSADGRSVFLAVRGAQNGIVRASTTLIAGVQPLMQGDAQEIRINGDRALYFTTGNTTGVQKLALEPGARPEPIAALKNIDPARTWFIDHGLLFYLDLHDPTRRLRSYTLSTGQLEVVTAALIRPAFLDGSLSYDFKDRLLIYSEWSEEAGSQIFLLYPSGKPLNEE